MTRRLNDRKRAARFRRMLMCGRPWVECHYCGKQLDISAVTLDHVVPLSKGGRMGIVNIVASCVNCNRAKANIDYAKFVRRIAA